MKTLLFAITLLISVTVFGVTQVITNSESKIILRHIDSVCADTWCEGDFDFKFNSLVCYDSGNCDFSLDYIYYDWSDTDLYEEGPEVIIEVPVNCELQGFDGRDDIIHTDKLSGQITYSNKLYYEITDCIDSNEDAVYEEIKKHYNY